MSYLKYFLLTGLFFMGILVQAQTIETSRTDLILKGFNSKPQDLIRPLVATDIELGRIDVSFVTRHQFDKIFGKIASAVLADGHRRSLDLGKVANRVFHFQRQF